MNRVKHRGVGTRSTAMAILAILAAGCTSDAPGGPGETPDQSHVASPPDAGPRSAGTGAIEGVVVSDESAPISGATVAIVRPIELQAKTDSAGAFRFERLAPGDYALFATALGFEEASRMVHVQDDEASPVRLVLEPMPVRTPTTASFVDDFFWACAVSTLGTGTACYNFSGTTLQEKHTVTHGSDPGLIAVVASVHWTPNQYLGAKRTGVSAWDLGQKSFNTTVGFSPVTTRLLWDDEKQAKDTITTWNYFGSYCTATSPTNCASDPPHSLLQVVIEQRFKAYTTFFYVDPPPAGFVGVPP